MVRRFVLTALLVLTGCASPTVYQPAARDILGNVVGYSEQKLSEKTFRVAYAAGPNGHQIDALSAWRRRATELCPSGYEQQKGPTISLNAREFLAVYGGGVYVRNETTQRPFVDGIIVCN